MAKIIIEIEDTADNLVGYRVSGIYSPNDHGQTNAMRVAFQIKTMLDDIAESMLALQRNRSQHGRTH